MERFHPVRSGDEPLHARSPLRLRLGLASFGLVCGVAGIIVFALLHAPAGIGLCAALAVFAIVDALVIMRHMRAGSDFQPGRDIPPYRSASPGRPTPRASAVTDPRRRHARYLWAAGVALVLVVNAWTWVWRISVPWAAFLSIAAGILLLIGVVASNAGSAILRGNAVPDHDYPGDPDTEATENAENAEKAEKERADSEPAHSSRSR